MSREERARIGENTRRLLHGPLKHARTAALAAALVPLASVAAAQSVDPLPNCFSGGAVIGDYVWIDTNKNGVQDAGETPLVNAVVSLVTFTYSDTYLPINSGPDGSYKFEGLCPGSYRVSVQIPPSMEPSPADQGLDDEDDSDGVPSGPDSAALVMLAANDQVNNSVDFGFFNSSTQQPGVGTGTPGYWKNHPEAWPVDEITVGLITYTRDQALAMLMSPGSDKSLTMFSSLVPAMLNRLIGNEAGCVEETIAAANKWMESFPPGSKVHAASLAWKKGEPMHRILDNYNNGMLCAPHRD